MTRQIDCHTRRCALHVTLALIIGTLAIAGIAEEIKKRKAVDSYLRHLDSRIERVDVMTPVAPHEMLLSRASAHNEKLEPLAI
ncbi:MAG: hypothetical protein ACKVH7_01420 [Alphaproteobacteria bacterium]|jgi:hypothetical protein